MMSISSRTSMVWTSLRLAAAFAIVLKIFEAGH